MWNFVISEEELLDSIICNISIKCHYSSFVLCLFKVLQFENRYDILPTKQASYHSLGGLPA